ncbi:unnamed protein product [Amoebophrya sp. A120]|nr:unnamed protein product [Amoebophrya sp. A120]|eukprot:GSA120T00020745001.1
MATSMMRNSLFASRGTSAAAASSLLGGPAMIFFFSTILFLAHQPVTALSRWQVSYQDVGSEDYVLTMSWYHDPQLAIVGRDLAKNPGQQDGSTSKTKAALGVCDPQSTAKAADGKLYWAPRIFPQPVSAEVTRKTGIHFASVDWQPCGHKDVVICHGESHYDFHLYYVSQAELNGYTCSNPNPVCPDLDDTNQRNHKFYKLMKGNIPSFADKATGDTQQFNFCVDPTSAMPNSGIHYGDKSETLSEWRNPVTVLGSYDCKLTFFEPMFSWKWVQGKTGSGEWPKYDSGRITYDEKNFRPLPDSWSVEVDRVACATTNPSSDCKITVTIRGKRCGASGCGALPQECGLQRNCINNQFMGRMPAVVPSPVPAPQSTAAGVPAPAPASSASSRTTPTTTNYVQSSSPSASNYNSSPSTASILANAASSPSPSPSVASSSPSPAGVSPTPLPAPAPLTPETITQNAVQKQFEGIQRVQVLGLNGYIIPSHFEEAMRGGFSRYLGINVSQITIKQMSVVGDTRNSLVMNSARQRLLLDDQMLEDRGEQGEPDRHISKSDVMLVENKNLQQTNSLLTEVISSSNARRLQTRSQTSIDVHYVIEMVVLNSSAAQATSTDSQVQKVESLTNGAVNANTSDAELLRASLDMEISTRVPGLTVSSATAMQPARGDLSSNAVTRYGASTSGSLLLSHFVAGIGFWFGMFGLLVLG